MSVLLVLLAVTLSGEDGSSIPSGPAASPQVKARRIEGAAAATGPTISYEVRYVTMTDLDWRGKFDPKLIPVARQGGAAVWAADSATLAEWLNFCQADSRCRIVQAPKVTTPAGGEVSLTHGEVIHYVAHLERVADGPINKASKLAFKPEIAQVHNGIRTRLSSGRIEEQGLRARFLIENDRLVSFQASQYREMVNPLEESPVEPQGLFASGVNRLAQPHAASLAATIQYPVVDSARVDGEWLIPTEGALIVSLGSSLKKGKVLKEIRNEELVVIRYRPDPGASPTPIAAEQTAAVRPTRLKSPAAN
ncbi:hypothetical protein SAMN05444166_5661 [Singulisphaera sp. GP187]|uniref:hypothetical protein n=1 Tax=Singulisphaera sp. GP187 TaxID=1882752 RepID=UPI00092830A7|nr:hypothetical protein [Singulisphaera sp. GP187]SIO58389.1 hypothetical protein SAMN05444166_5661 [Singulisphaera sp. GP187]